MSHYNQHFIQQSNQPKKLWRLMATLLGSNTSKHQSLNQPKAADLSFFNSKVESVQQATAESNRPPSPAVFESFEPYLSDEVGKTISSIPTKSCSLDPLMTYILKEFLQELLPFIVDMCNMSFEEGCPPISQRHALVTPCLKKAGANQTDLKKYRFISKIVEKLVCRQLITYSYID